jgi:SAM-dependent methyltransferase
MTNVKEGNREARRAWDANARHWDQQMGEGNHFVEILLWPAIERLLAPRAGERILDVACGNGLTSRRLAAGGAEVVAFDFSAKMIEIARERSAGSTVDFRVLDATDREALLALGESSFDGALCNMAIMDLADLPPLMESVARLLCPGGRFVFSICHPCFNNPSVVQIGELEDREGDFVTTYAVKISRYQTPFTRAGAAMHGQPEPHPYFHRSLQTLLGAAFDAGLAVDGLEERAFPPENRDGTTSLSWNGNFSEIPPVLVVRLRRMTQ